MGVIIIFLGILLGGVYTLSLFFRGFSYGVGFLGRRGCIFWFYRGGLFIYCFYHFHFLVLRGGFCCNFVFRVRLVLFGCFFFYSVLASNNYIYILYCVVLSPHLV